MSTNQLVNGEGIGARASRDQWTRLEQGLREMAAASRPNWDGYGAAAARPELIDIAAQILRQLAGHANVQPPYVCLTRIGGALMEWKNGGFLVQLEIEHDGTIEVMHGPEGGPYLENAVSGDLSQWSNETWEALAKANPAVKPIA